MNRVREVSHVSDMPLRTEEEQRAFFEVVMERAIAADAQARTGEYFLSIAGACIRLLFASDSLQRTFLPAISHLRTSASPKPDATFYIWDTSETGVDIVRSPCSASCFTDRGDIWGFNSARIRSAFHWDECSLSLMDMEAGLGTFWVQSGKNLPYWTKASPLRTLFNWLMTQHGCQLLHAAAVGTADGGVLISGKGGVGKSTTAIACLASGMKYVADDYLVVQLDPEPKAFSLYATAKLEAPQLQRFPGLQCLLADTLIPQNEKAVLNLSQSDTYSVTPSLPLVAALTPRFVSQSETTLRPAEHALLVHSAAFTTMAQLPHSGLATHEFIGRFMARLPCFELLLGHDIDRIPSALTAFLAQPQEAATTLRSRGVKIRKPDRPLVSVVIPIYNGAHFLRQAVDSILGQVYSPLEIIVVDDGSTDNIEGAIRELSTDVRLLGQKNAGPAGARNLGIRNAVGDFLAFLDVDDLWPQDTLTTLAARLVERPDTDIVHGYGQLVRSDNAGGLPEFIGNARESFPYYIGAALYRRRAFERIDLFDEDLRFGEDTDWFNRAREKGLGIERLDRVTLLVRRHGGNMTKNKSVQELGTLRIFKKALDRRRARDLNCAETEANDRKEG